MDNGDGTLFQLKTRQRVSSNSQNNSDDSNDPHPHEGDRGLEQANIRIMEVDTLISLMGPLITSCRLCGIIHMRSDSSVILRDEHRVSKKVGRLYSTVLMAILWLDFARSLSCFKKDNDIGEQLFFKILFCVWKFVVCCNFTACFRACLRRRGFLELLDDWTKEMEETHKEEPCCKYVRRKNIMYTSICWVFVVLNMTCIVLASYLTNLFEMDYQPFEPNYEYIDVVKGVCLAILLIRSCAWLLPVALFYSVCSLLRWHLHVLSEEFARIKHSETVLEQLEKIRQKHQRLCKLVEQADALISPILAVQFVSSVAILCITFYIIVYPDDSDDANDALLLFFTKIFWLVVSGTTLTIFCMGAASVNSKVKFVSAFNTHDVSWQSSFQKKRSFPDIGTRSPRPPLRH